MNFPQLNYSEEQLERMKACWDACEGIPTDTVKKLKVTDLMTLIKNAREVLGIVSVKIKESVDGK